jgi:hypothetical protein
MEWDGMGGCEEGIIGTGVVIQVQVQVRVV